MKTNLLFTSIILSLCFCITTSKSNAQWQIQNPLPTGNDMTGIFFTDSLNGWVVCANGAYYETQDKILHTSDGGLNWGSQSCNVEEHLRAVNFFDPFNGWIVGYNGTIIRTTDGGINWTTIDSPVLVDFKAVWALSSQSAVIVGKNGTIMKTEDGGSSWTIIDIGFTGSLYDLNFISSDEGWVVGDSLMIYHTVNGGLSWEQLSEYPIGSGDYTSVYFSDPLNGWITKTYGYWGTWACLIQRTFDGGITWEEKHNHYASKLFSISFTDSNNGYAVGFEIILNTIDGGNSWQENPIDAYGYGRLCCVESGQVWAAFRHTIVNSNNNGVTWQNQLDISCQKLTDVQFLDPSYGWAVGWTGLMQTTDGGLSWSNNDSIHGNSLCFVDNLNGWVVDKGGNIYRTENGGTTWGLQESGTEGELMSVYFTDPLNGWIVSRGNLHPAVILHTDNGGNTWQIQDTVNNTLYSIMFLDENNGWAVGGNGNIYSTNNGGQNWNHTKIGDQYEFILKSVYFINEYTGWVAGSEGTIYHTQDGGVNWIEQSSWTNCYLKSIFFTDLNNGWACGGDYGMPSRIISTNNGGLTWQLQVIDIGRWFASLYFTDTNNGWAVGFGGMIMHTENGGFVEIKEPQINKSSTNIQCYPNPFSETTTLSYSLKQKSVVSIEIYNSQGQSVFKQIGEVKSEGIHKMIFGSQNFPVGIYFCVLKTNEGSQTIKIIKN